MEFPPFRNHCSASPPPSSSPHLPLSTPPPPSSSSSSSLQPHHHFTRFSRSSSLKHCPVNRSHPSVSTGPSQILNLQRQNRNSSASVIRGGGGKQTSPALNSSHLSDYLSTKTAAASSAFHPSSPNRSFATPLPSHSLSQPLSGSSSISHTFLNVGVDGSRIHYSRLSPPTTTTTYASLQSSSTSSSSSIPYNHHDLREVSSPHSLLPSPSQHISTAYTSYSSSSSPAVTFSAPLPPPSSPQAVPHVSSCLQQPSSSSSSTPHTTSHAYSRSCPLPPQTEVYPVVSDDRSDAKMEKQWNQRISGLVERIQKLEVSLERKCEEYSKLNNRYERIKMDYSNLIKSLQKSLKSFHQDHEQCIAECVNYNQIRDIQVLSQMLRLNLEFCLHHHLEADESAVRQTSSSVPTSSPSSSLLFPNSSLPSSSVTSHREEPKSRSKSSSFFNSISTSTLGGKNLLLSRKTPPSELKKDRQTGHRTKNASTTSSVDLAKTSVASSKGVVSQHGKSVVHGTRRSEQLSRNSRNEGMKVVATNSPPSNEVDMGLSVEKSQTEQQAEKMVQKRRNWNDEETTKETTKPQGNAEEEMEEAEDNVVVLEEDKKAQVTVAELQDSEVMNDNEGKRQNHMGEVLTYRSIQSSSSCSTNRTDFDSFRGDRLLSAPPVVIEKKSIRPIFVPSLAMQKAGSGTWMRGEKEPTEYPKD